ncbi:MAG: FHA domain-containing protein [Prevotella sp.]|nr:FHA domain-containing protein [Prevotella sp.]
MKQITIGTEGNQPFKITNSGVSRKHATITIDDSGIWRLEDLNSTNGTYIRSEDGETRRVATVEINELTFIRLGPDNVNGCCFYARQLLGVDNFTKEFEYLNEIEDKFELKEKKAEKVSKYMRYAIALISGIALLGSLAVKGSLQIMLLRLSSIVSMISSIFYDPVSKKKKISGEREKFYHCPNPKCSHILTVKEIRTMQCAKCKAK